MNMTTATDIDTPYNKLPDDQKKAIRDVADSLKMSSGGPPHYIQGRALFNLPKTYTEICNTYGAKSEFAYTISKPLFEDLLLALITERQQIEKATQTQSKPANVNPFVPKQEWESWTLTERDRHYLDSFRYSVDDDGQPCLYAKTGHSEAEEYRPVGITVGPGAEVLAPQMSATFLKVGRTLYSELLDEYEIELHRLDNTCNADPESVNKILYGVVVHAHFVDGEPPSFTMEAKSFTEYLKGILPYLLKDESMRIDEPVIISNDPKTPTFFYFDLKSITNNLGDTPTWDGWMLGMPDYCRPIFSAWVYSIFDPANMGRQALWLKGEGFNGKSIVGNVLNDYIGRAGGALSKSSMHNQFAYSFIYGKRFLVYGDCKNNRIISSERMHSILGGDQVSIEAKGKQPFTGYVHAKMYIAANIDPEIDSQFLNELTRIIYIPMQEPPASILKNYCQTDDDGKIMRDGANNPIMLGSNNFKKNLAAELPAFLSKARQHYKNLCPTRQQIVLPELMMDSIRNYCVDTRIVQFEGFIDNELEFGDGFILKAGELHDHFREMMKDADNNTFKDFKRFFETVHRVRPLQHIKEDGERRKCRHYAGVRVRGMAGGGTI